LVRSADLNRSLAVYVFSCFTLVSPTALWREKQAGGCFFGARTEFRLFPRPTKLRAPPDHHIHKLTIVWTRAGAHCSYCFSQSQPESEREWPKATIRVTADLWLTWLMQTGRVKQFYEGALDYGMAAVSISCIKKCVFLQMRSRSILFTLSQ